MAAVLLEDGSAMETMTVLMDLMSTAVISSVTKISSSVRTDTVSRSAGGVMQTLTAWMAVMRRIVAILLVVTVLRMSSSVTTLCVNPSLGSVMEKTTVGTTLTRTLKSAGSSSVLQLGLFAARMIAYACRYQRGVTGSITVETTQMK